MSDNFWIQLAIVTPFIAAWSAFLVFFDPLTRIAEWWENRR